MSDPRAIANPSSQPALWRISVKGVLFRAGQVVLLKNERDEWELPGGRLELGESPPDCLARECAEELGIEVTVEQLLDCWRYQVLPNREVLIVTYGCSTTDLAPAVLSHEHKEVGWFPVGAVADLRMPEGYRRSIREWMARRP